MPAFRISAPGLPPTTYRLYKNVTSIGTQRDHDIVLPDPMAEADFASIVFDGQTYTLQTLGKKTKALINGKPRTKHKLSHGDRLVVGTCELRFSLVDELAAEPPSAGTTSVTPYARLFEFSERLMEKRTLTELLEALMDAVVEITSGQRGFLVLMDGETPDIKVARNLQRENIADAVSQLSDSIVAKVVRTHKPVVVSDAMNDAEFAAAHSIMQLRISSVMCVPLLARGRLLGLIYVGSDSIRQPLREASLQAVTIFAAQAALIVESALLLSELTTNNVALTAQLETYKFGAIIGSSPGMQQVFRHVEKLAGVDVAVLITGETGTGKELIAREIHVRSPRAKRPFISINCGAIPAALLESELFGHVRGAFTGATQTQIGKFQAANGGTLFLDEIGEMAIELQVKLLRALQDKIVCKVGETRPEHVDIRIVAATNRNLMQEIAAGRFREDLHYRLNVISLHLPPLRERGEDVIVIAGYLLKRYTEEYKSKIVGFAPDALAAMRKHGWPGNIRELENRLKKAVVLSSASILTADDVGLTDQADATILPLAEAKERFARQYINDVLALNNGNRSKAARDLGVDPRTVFRHLEKEACEDA